MIRRLKIKFVLTVMFMITVLLIAILAFFYIHTGRTLYNDSMDAMRDYSAIQPSMIFNDRFEKIFGSENGNGKYSHLNIFIIEYYTNSGIIVPYGFEETLTDEQKDYIYYVVGSAIESDEKNGVIEKYNLRYLKTDINSGVKIVFLDKSYEDLTLHSLLISILLIGCGGLVCFFLITLIICKIAVSPIEKSIKQQKQLVADVSHELKTPLSVIGANTEIIASHSESTVGDQSKWLGYIKNETERMANLISGMLYLAKSDEAAESYEKYALDFSNLALGAALPFESVCFEKGLELNCNIEPGLGINGNRELLVRLVGILIDNAVKYSYPVKDGKVIFNLFYAQDRIIMTVNNKGDIITPEQAGHIFERFYRVDESRARCEGGFGLGLSIAKSIVDIHGGKITVKSSRDDGTTFTCTFKRL
ncbi:MAG: HAMP domain-containing sensor histidine kinase [Eubacteriales bacterium]|nr:HAMP domain-containing sensor histidine kinase [Eubacteriales bacterium]